MSGVVPHPDDIAAQLRRRREAASRLPAYNQHGDRDPLDAMVRLHRPVAWLTEDPKRGLVLVTGSPRKTIWACIVAAGLRDEAVWSDSGGGWTVPADRASDVEVMLTRSLVIVRIRNRPDGEARK